MRSTLRDSRDYEEPMDVMDLTANRYERELKIEIHRHDRQMVAEIHGALRRIAAGTFGICENCGDDIAVERLRAQPFTRVCIECRRKMEAFGAPERCVIRSKGRGAFAFPRGDLHESDKSGKVILIVIEDLNRRAMEEAETPNLDILVKAGALGFACTGGRTFQGSFLCAVFSHRGNLRFAGFR